MAGSAEPQPGSVDKGHKSLHRPCLPAGLAAVPSPHVPSALMSSLSPDPVLQVAARSIIIPATGLTCWPTAHPCAASAPQERTEEALSTEASAQYSVKPLLSPSQLQTLPALGWPRPAPCCSEDARPQSSLAPSLPFPARLLPCPLEEKHWHQPLWTPAGLRESVGKRPTPCLPQQKCFEDALRLQSRALVCAACVLGEILQQT